MLPHASDVQSITTAFVFCRDGLTGLDREVIPEDHIQDLLHELDQHMDVSTLVYEPNENPYSLKASLLDIEQLKQFSLIVDELATWFECEFQKP